MKRLILGSLSLLLLSATTALAGPPPGYNNYRIPHSANQLSTAAVKSGIFVAGEHPTTGTVRLVSENGQRYLEFGADFRTDSGPDLVVILHRSDNVIGTTNPPAYSINEGDYVTLAPLQKTNGTQRYAIPEGVNLENYQSVAVWCRQFNATFGAAMLRG
jgi:type 1 glutamine amidotransferase